MTYDTLPIGKYCEIVALAADDTLDEVTQQAEILAVLYDTTADEILNLPITEYARRAAESDFLRQDFPDFSKRKIASVYKVGGFELVPVRDPLKMTAAQYIDFQSFAKMDAKGVSKIVELLSCLMVPQGRRYAEGYDVAKVQDALRDGMPTLDALALSAFFLSRCRKYIADTLTSFARKMKRKGKTEVAQRLEEAVTSLSGGDS